MLVIVLRVPITLVTSTSTVAVIPSRGHFAVPVSEVLLLAIARSYARHGKEFNEYITRERNDTHHVMYRPNSRHKLDNHILRIHLRSSSLHPHLRPRLRHRT